LLGVGGGREGKIIAKQSEFDVGGRIVEGGGKAQGGHPVAWGEKKRKNTKIMNERRAPHVSRKQMKGVISKIRPISLHQKRREGT